MTRVLFVVLLSGALQAAAQTYPGKTVRIVVPFPAGGSTDVLARMSAEHLNKTHGQLFIVDNRPGATGTIASALVANSAPDGYTLLMHSVSTYIAGYMYKKVSYDPAKAFAPIVNLSVNPFILVSSASLPVKSVKELVALARSRPGDLTFGTVGKGAYTGPSLQSWDMGLLKNFRMGSDINVQFRAEFFNIFNQVNFDLPKVAVNNASTLGKFTATDPNSGDPRIIQFGLKFVF